MVVWCGCLRLLGKIVVCGSFRYYSMMIVYVWYTNGKNKQRGNESTLSLIPALSFPPSFLLSHLGPLEAGGVDTTEQQQVVVLRDKQNRTGGYQNRREAIQVEGGKVCVCDLLFSRKI